MPMALKTFSLIHYPLHPPGETTVQIAIKRQLVSSTKWAFFKKKKKSAFSNPLLVGSCAPCHFCLLHRIPTP